MSFRRLLVQILQRTTAAEGLVHLDMHAAVRRAAATGKSPMRTARTDDAGSEQALLASARL